MAHARPAGWAASAARCPPRGRPRSRPGSATAHRPPRYDAPPGVAPHATFVQDPVPGRRRRWPRHDRTPHRSVHPGRRARRRDPPQGGEPGRAGRALPRPDRPSSTAGSTPSASGPTTRSARPRRPRPTRWWRRPSPDDLPPFHGVPLPIKDLTTWPAGPPPTGRRRRPGAGRRSRTRSCDGSSTPGFVLLGKTTTLRVRHRQLHRERRAGHHPQPVGPRPHAGRLVGRRGRRGGRRHGAHRPRQRRRRVDPRSRRRATAWSGSSRPAAGSPTRPSSSRAWPPAACSPAAVADAAAGLDVLGPPRSGRLVVAPAPAAPFASAAGGGATGRSADRRPPRRADRRPDRRPRCVAAVEATLRALESAGPPPGRRSPGPAAGRRARRGLHRALERRRRRAPARRPGRDRAPQPGPARGGTRHRLVAYAEAVKTTQSLSRRIVESFVGQLRPARHPDDGVPARHRSAPGGPAPTTTR